MKRLGKSRVFRAVALFLGYCLGLFPGVCATAVYPIYFKQRPSLLSQAEYIAGVSGAHSDEALHRLTGPTTRVLVYNRDGGILKEIYPTAFPPQIPLDGLLTPFRGMVETGENFFKIVPAQESPRVFSHFWMITGVPMMADGQLSGTVFLVKNLENIQEALIGYFIYYSLFYWMAALLLWIYLRKKRRLEQVQQNYVANVTHALKTPIASIRALTEALSDVVEPDVDVQRSYYGMILQETNLQSHMVQEILDLSRLQSRGADFKCAPVNAAEALAETLEKYEVLCACAGITFSVSEALPALPSLWTNGARLAQMIQILLENAVKYVNDNGMIRLDAVQNRRHVVFSVHNTGSLIEREELSRVFERFYQGQNSKGKTGTGLGLAIAREIADGLDEQIWAESAVGTGTAVSFTIRLQRHSALARNRVQFRPEEICGTYEKL